MNILYINLYDYFGGAEKIFDLCCREGRKEHTCYRFVLAGDKCGDGRSYRIMKKSTFAENTLVSFEGIKRLVRIWTLLHIIWIIKRKKIDLVHLHNTHGFLISPKGMKILLRFAPVVWTLHDMWSMTGYCAYSAKCDGWKKGCKKCENLPSYPALPGDYAGKLFRQKKALYTEKHLYRVCPSRWLYDRIAASKIGNKNLFCIHNGVDISAFRRIDKMAARKKHGLHEEGKYLLFVSASVGSRKKGMKYLLDAIKLLADMDGLELLVVGNMNHGTAKSRMPVHRFGYVSDEKTMNEIYAAADLFVLPSIEDNFPCTVLEAMASGTAVAAFKVGGIVEQLDGKSGFLAGEISSKALAETIREALSDDEKLRRVSENAYRRCVRLFSSEKMNENYEGLYKKAVREYRCR